MDKTLESFLHPHRKPNVKFKLPAFDEEFEMRALSVDETIAIDKEAHDKDWPYSEVLIHYVAAALVTPNLRSKDLQDALSEQAGHKLMDPYDVYRALFNGPESAKIVSKYIDVQNLNMSFSQKVEEAKN